MPVAVLDQDQSPASRELIGKVFANDDFTRAESVRDVEAAEEVLVRGQAIGVLVIEPDFASRLAHGQNGRIGMWFDASDPNTAVQARAKAEQLISNAVNSLGST